MKRKLLSFIILFALMLSCSGCNDKEEFKNSEYESSITEISAEETDIQTDTEVSPVRMLECAETEGGTYFDYAGGNRIIVCCYDKDVLQDDNGSYFKYYIADIEKDEIVSEGRLPYEERFIGARKNGQIITLNIYDMKINIYTQDFKLIRSIDSDTSEIEFDEDNDCIYKTYGGMMKKLDFDGKEEVMFSFRKDTEIKAFDAKNGLAVLIGKSTDDKTEREFSLYSVKDKKIILSGKDDFYFYGFSENMLTVQKWEETDETAKNIVDVYDVSDTENIHTFSFSQDESLYGSPYTEYEGIIERPSSENGKYSLEFADFADRKTADMNLYFDKDSVFSSLVYIKDTERFVISVITRKGEKQYTNCYEIDINELDFSGKLNEVKQQETEDEKTEIHKAGENLKELRERADEMEKEYSVRILLGDEILNAKPSRDFGTVSTENEEYSSDYESDREELTEALDSLEKVLETYPEDFFREFYNYKGEGGIRFIIVRSFLNDNGSFIPGGLEYNYGGWYNLALAADNIQYSQDVIHHEIWHAVESRIADENPNAFDEELWNSFNPDGFEYGEDFDTYNENANDSSYFLFGGDDVYFDQSYSTVTEKEDRATIIQRIYTDEEFAGYYGFDNFYQMVCSHPHLKAKLDFMSDKVEDVFGSVYWEDYFE